MFAAPGIGVADPDGDDGGERARPAVDPTKGSMARAAAVEAAAVPIRGAGATTRSMADVALGPGPPLPLSGTLRGRRRHELEGPPPAVMPADRAPRAWRRRSS